MNPLIPGMGSNLQTPRELAGMPELEAETRNYLANPHTHPVTPSSGPTASGASSWTMLLPVSNESRADHSTVSLVNGKLQLLKPRKYDLKEWTSYMMDTVRRLFAYESGLITITPDLVPLTTMTTSRELETYIAWVLGMIHQYTWPTMLEFDTHIREQMTITQSGSFNLVVILAAFLTRCACKGTLTKAQPNKDNKTKNKCLHFNREGGCTRNNCPYTHACSTCGSKSHGKTNHT